jgi:3D-(3,5/4)-trihydroxycyclohexane-1,2-dione acylhydrolase (decyclizing)
LVGVDFAAHASSLGCDSETVSSPAELADALGRARKSDRTYVISMRTAPDVWTEGGAFWEVGVPEQSERAAVTAARRAMDEGKRAQRMGL